MKCFYHNDNDGVFSAACVHAFVEPNLYLAVDATPGSPCGDESCDYVSIDYKDSFPFESIRRNEVVFILDYSIPPDEMKRLLEITANVVWIDHHKTAIDKYADWDGPEICGYRKDGEAACTLTFRYIMWWTNTAGRPNSVFGEYMLDPPVPLCLQLVGDRDTWTWKFGDDTKLFHAGIQLYDMDPTNTVFSDMLRLDFEQGSKNVRDICEQGQAVETYRQKFFKKYRDTYAFDALFEGHKCRAMNIATVGSEAFGDEFSKYDIVIPFIWDGAKFTVSLYSDKKVDVSEIAKKYGGGGHVNASGFQCSELPFRVKSNGGFLSQLDDSQAVVDCVVVNGKVVPDM